MTEFEKTRWSCLVGSLIICLCAGFGYAWSVLQAPIAAFHGWADSRVSLAYTVTVVCSTMAPIFFAGVIRRLGTRRCVMVGAALFGGGLILTGTMTAVWQLYFFYGVLSGLGCGFIYPSMMAYVVRIFPDRSGMASGLGTAAYGSGAILWAPVAVALQEVLPLPRVFQALGGVFFAVILLSAFLLREPSADFVRRFAKTPEANASSDGDLCRSQMLRTGTFFQMVVVFTCALVAGTIVISQASPILQQTLNFSAGQAAAFVSVFAACNMAGRFFWGGVSDRLGIRKVVAVVFILCILSMLLLSFSTQTAVVIGAMALAASCYGGFASVLTPLTAQMFGTTYITENYGAMYVVFGIAALIGPSLAVYFKGVGSGSYSGAFLAAAVMAAAGLVTSRFLKSQVR